MSIFASAPTQKSAGETGVNVNFWNGEIYTKMTELDALFNASTGHKHSGDPDDGGTVITAGTIVLWSGSIASIPTGWVFCNGNNGTPDLRSKFIVCANTGDYPVAGTGGEKEHTLTEAEMPVHNHSYTKPIGLEDVTSGGNHAVNSTTGDNTGNAGSGNAHENRPPYYALAYIMKT